MKILKLILTALLIFVVDNSIQAGEPKFLVSEIAPELKENAQSVIRYYNQTLEVNSISDAKLIVSYAITILNKNGLEDSFFVEYYDKDIKINSISGTIYNKDGEKIKRLEKSELLDFSAISGFSIYEDSRVKYYNPEVMDFPFTVEYEYEVHLKGYINLPNWSPYNQYNKSIENSKLEVSYPSELNVRFNEKNIQKKDSLVIENVTHITWEVSDLKAFEKEPFMSPDDYYLPYVAVAPTEFKFEGYKGNSSSWKEFGNWINQLNEGRDVLPEQTKQTIQAIVENLDTDKEKIFALYKYLQNNTRYVSIQLGIGGFQPFEADVVDRLKYGDCKALTNYLVSLFQVAGIKSYYTLVGAGENNSPLMREFPSSQFNHAFLCVPIETDTLWLECTNQRVPCGYMGDFTDDRDVLVVNDEGGKLVRTPKYTPEQNSKVSNMQVELYDDGNASVALNSKYYGPYLNEVLQILRFDSEGKEKYLYQSLHVPKSKINNYRHSVEESFPYGNQEINFEVGNMATKMGKNLFLNPNILSKMDELPGRPEQRLTDIYIRRSKSNVDTTVFKLGENIIVSSIPEEIVIESCFGRYSSKLISSEGKLTYYRYFEMKAGTYPKKSIDELYQFYKDIAKADRQRVALKVL